jgi:hypothetical protein
MLIVLLGPQASGKTTQAMLLKKKFEKSGYRVLMTESIHYTILLRAWYKFLISISGRKIRYKFRDENLVEEFVEPYLLARTFPVDFIINMVSAIISSLKILLLSIFYPIIIEHEGFIYNQFAYLCFIYRKIFDIKFLLKKYKMFFKFLPKERLVVLLDITNLRPIDLQIRYCKRKSLSEPWYYIKYQAIIYRALALSEHCCAIFDASMDKFELFNAIFAFILQSLRSLRNGGAQYVQKVNINSHA